MHYSTPYLLIILSGMLFYATGLTAADTDFKTGLNDGYALLQLGGPVVMVLIGMSIVGLAILLYKLLQFRRFSNTVFSKLDRVLSGWLEGDCSTTAEHIKTIDSPVAAVLETGMILLDQVDFDEERIREELTRQAQWVALQVYSLLRFMEQIAYLAPLLGLLGTVLGIIDVFQGLADRGVDADPGILAGGIWEALLTTAVGLTVAIPFALLHAVLESRANTIRMKMEDLLTRLFTLKRVRRSVGGAE